MRTSTASLILAFCAMLAVQAAPTFGQPEGALAIRYARGISTVEARGIEVHKKCSKNQEYKDGKCKKVTRDEGGLEEREAKKKCPNGEEDKDGKCKKKGDKSSRDENVDA